MSAEPVQGGETECRVVWDALTGGHPVVVTSHVRLDGDGVGSALALWHGLRMRGVAASLYFEPPTPSMFEFLPGMGECCTELEALPASYTLAVLDCGGLDRTGGISNGRPGRLQTINIDHHDSNAHFGDINWVDPDASSCGEMVHRLLRFGGVPFTREIAECLFTAIVSDTGQFAHQETTAEAFSICADCVRAGVRPYHIVRRLFMSPSPAQVKLRHLALGTLRFHCGGQVATMEVTREMYETTGLGPIDTEGFAEVPVSIQGVEASALLKDMPGCEYIKVSMRSRDKVDVCAVARSFGGGGHRRAAGCEIPDTMQNALSAIVGELGRQLGERGD